MKISLLPSDRRIWQEELADFVPGRIFDAHTHLYDVRFAPVAAAVAWRKQAEYSQIDFNGLQRISRALFPGRKVHYLSCGLPLWRNMNFDGMNDFVARAGQECPQPILLMLANPDWGVKDIERRLDKHKFAGFKPYMFTSRSRNPAQATVLQMLPEHYWRIANERELLILLHLGRYRSLADPLNQRQVRFLAERYPRARLQLAHCARCFTPEIAEKSLSSIADLPNIHLDTSAVCEGEVFHILLDIWPRKRLLFGSDNPVGIRRGKIASFGLGWFTVSEQNSQAFAASHVPYRPTFLAYENLRAIRYAAKRKQWGAREWEDFFWNNAVRIFRLQSR